MENKSKIGTTQLSLTKDGAIQANRISLEAGNFLGQLVPDFLRKVSKSLKAIALTVVFIVFSFFPSWSFLGDTSSQWAMAAPAASKPLGTIPGEFAVNGNGGATYTVPIEVPPGINEVQPNLSLVYNSQQKNGLLGVGWQLAGLSAIARCGQTIATDGVRGGVNFDSGDRFCFDGQRLMAVSGSYGAEGTEYHTERETWVRVISHGSQNGPQYFTVTTKDGYQVEFGNTDDSRILARGRSDQAVRVWALNKISDRNGNFVEVSYQEDTSEGKSGAFLGYYPTEIRYTGNSGVTPLRLVKFDYKDNEEREDKIIAYVGGSEAETTKRLAGIKTYVALDGNGSSIETTNNLVKEYSLAYEYGAATGRSRLTQLKECDAAGVCLPPTNFSWQNGNKGTFGEEISSDCGNGKRCDSLGNVSFGDFNGDGLTDVFNRGVDFEVWLSQGNGTFGEEITSAVCDDPQGCVTLENISFVDFNGDGLTDVFNRAVDFEVWLSQGDGKFAEEITSVCGNVIRCDSLENVSFGDFNGDGLTDVINRGVDFEVWLSQGDGTFGEETTSAAVCNNHQGCDSLENVSFGDFNGDGLTDIINRGVDFEVWLSQGDGTFAEEISSPEVCDDTQGCINLENVSFGDFNGDGLTDVFNRGVDFEVWLSQGDGTFAEEISSVACNDAQGCINLENIPFGDFNGDGLTDVFNRGVDFEVWLSKEDGMFGAKISSAVCDNNNNRCDSLENVSFGDFNGDGLTDIINRGVDFEVWLSNAGKIEQADLMFQITNGLGERTQIKYKPLTDKTIYTKGSEATYPEVDVQSSIYVVSRYEIAESETAPTNTFIYEQKYEGAKIDRHRSWLGFEKIHLIDVENHTETTTTYHTQFPLLGLVSDREIKDTSNDQVLGKISSSYDYLPQDAEATGEVYKFWQDAITLERYTAGSPNYTLQRTYGYDADHQNVILVSDLGDTNEPDYKVYTCFAYAQGTGDDWWKSFFHTDQKTANSEDCQNFDQWNEETDLRWEKFDYDGQMNLVSHGNWLDRNGPEDLATEGQVVTPAKTLPWWQFGWVQAIFRAISGNKTVLVETQAETQGKWLNYTIGYDPYGNISTLTDPLGNSSTIHYDSIYHTFPEEYIAPEIKGITLTVGTEYEPKFGIKTQTIDPNGNIAMAIRDSGIDGFGRVLEIKGVKPDSSDLVTLIKNELSSEGNQLSVKSWYRTKWEGSDIPDDSWLWQQQYIDGLGRTYQSEEKASEGKTITNKVEFNPVGQVENEFLPYYTGEDVESFFAYKYNVRGNVEQITSPLEVISLAEYDTDLDAHQITYSFADPGDEVSENNFVKALVKDTSRGWVKEKQAPDGSQVFYTYDRLGQVKSMTDQLGQETEMVYNSLGQVISETTQETGTTEYFDNDNGQIAIQVDAKGQKISLEYDALGRVINKKVYNDKSDSEPRETITYEYDSTSVDNGKGALTGIVTDEVTYTFSYDNHGQIKEERVAIDTDGNGQETYISQYTYDAAGRPDTVIYPDGAIVRYTYDEGGDLYKVALKDTGEAEFTTYATYEDYTALGEIGKVTYNPNQVESNYRYDEIGRIKTSRTTKAAQTYFDFSYIWNKADKLLAITDNANKGLNQNFGYDIVGRLTSASGDTYEDLSYGYDPAGNITQRNQTTYGYKPDKQHQLADATYDANGNTMEYGPWNYTYDAQDRLLQVDQGSDTVNEFTYDDSGDRLSKIEADGTVTYYVAPLYEVVRNADGSQIHTKYIVGPQGTIAAISKDGEDTNLIAAIKANSANLEAELYDPHSGSGLAQFLSAKLNQLAFTNNATQILVGWILVVWILCALSIGIYRFWQSASRESWTGKSRAMVARISVGMGWITPETAERWVTPQPKGWLLQTGHRPVSFALALISFSSVSLSGPSLLAQLTPADSGEPGYPVAGQVLYFHYDQLGSTTLVTDPQANVVSQVNYEPYGAIAKSSTGEDAFRPKFTGKEYDSNSELYYFGARYYDANLGRFLTPDPARQYFSPYVYGNGDPLSGTDPTGMFFGIDDLIAGIIIGTVGLVSGYLGSATVNNSYNPASWDWSSGKTWGGIVGGAALGAASAAVGLATAGAEVAAIGATSAAEIGVTSAVERIIIGGGIAGVTNASFTAMAGGDAGDIASAFAIGFGTEALFAHPKISGTTNPSAKGTKRRSSGKRSGKNSSDIDTCSSSFVAGTEVATAQGEKAIEEIAVGDTVLAYNEERGEEGEYPVTHLFTRIAPESIAVTVGEEEIVTTPEHEFYTANGWVEAQDLAIGDTLVRLGGKTATVIDLEPHEDSTRVYNFEVDEAHTYYVSAERVIVHNVNNVTCSNLQRTSGLQYNGNQFDLIEANLQIGVHTGSPTNRNVRNAVNTPGGQYPRLIISEINYVDDQARAKTRFIAVRNPQPQNNGRWDAGHAIGKQNGGTGTWIGNIFPQNPTVNRFPVQGLPYTIQGNTKTLHSWRTFEDKINRKANKYPAQSINQKVYLFW